MEGKEYKEKLWKKREEENEPNNLILSLAYYSQLITGATPKLKFYSCCHYYKNIANSGRTIVDQQRLWKMKWVFGHLVSSGAYKKSIICKVLLFLILKTSDFTNVIYFN